MRFNKGNAAKKPLEYPLKKVPADHASSRLVSPVKGKANGLKVPSMPQDEGFLFELGEVLSVKSQVEIDAWPTGLFEAHGIDAEIPAPLLELFPDAVPSSQVAAELVHNDKPTDLGTLLIDYFRRAGRDWRAKTIHKDFLHYAAVLRDLSSEVSEALELAFEAKYQFGRPRPEEVLATNMTQYEEGCPCHPAYPAGHGVAAGRTFSFVKKVLKLNAADEKILETATKHWAMYRTLAGVHYVNDNLDGWDLGAK